MTVCGRRARFFGTVQGVGFRWTVTSACQRRGVVGWVRNERDGSVTAELFAAEEDLRAVLEEIRRQRRGFVERVDVEAIDPPSELPKSFGIVRHRA